MRIQLSFNQQSPKEADKQHITHLEENDAKDNTGGWSSGSGYIGMPGLHTVLTLNNLPQHTSVKLNFLLAVLDSWDGTVGDYFHVTIDGNSVFNYALSNYGPKSSYQNWPDWRNCVLAQDLPLAMSGGWYDACYNAGLSSAFDAIAHTNSTLKIE